MFYKKTINKLRKNFIQIYEDLDLTENRSNELNKRINVISDKTIELEKKIDAAIEFLKSDRNDINTLIQIIRKLQSIKRKK